MTISQRLYLILGIMVLLISAELSALWFTIHTLSAVRAYVGGEGLWSKAEKDAVYQLETYGRTHDERDYDAYRALLNVSLGDREARLEMAKASPDRNREVQGFIRGRNQPSDIPGMIALFARFSAVSYISEAIADWTQGDALMARIQTLATRLHDEVRAGKPASTIDGTLAEIGTVNKNVTVIEDRFSYTLGEGSRWLTDLVLTLLLGAALSVAFSGLLLTASVTRGISRRFKGMLGVAERIAKGDYRASLDDHSKDEIGWLSEALNGMARGIEHERAKAYAAARQTDAALKEAQRVAHIGSWDWDVDADAFVVSKEFLRLCDVDPDAFDSHYAGFMRLVHPGDRVTVEEALRSSLRSRDDLAVDFRVTLESGAERWLCAQGIAVTGAVPRLVGTIVDVTERKASEERFAYLAQHDPLTDLPNRTLLVDRLRIAIAAARRNGRSGALIFLDLDHFKELNDTLGHAAGDRLLISVGERLGAGLRDVDTVARSGGDEFLIVLSNLVSPDAASSAARHLLTAFATPFSIDGHEIVVTASMGISVFPNDGTDFEALIRNADVAMYQAKRQGRNKFQFYSAHMHDQAVRTLVLHTELRRALERHEFALHYQPLVDMATGEIVGAEALLRWNHPEDGLRMPDGFIGAAESSGLVVPIGEWVLHEACMQARRWCDEGFDRLRVSVNVSTLQLNQPDFAARVAGTVCAAGIAPTALELEITETAMMVEEQRAAGVLEELRSAGVRILLDGFGTGYSSLSHLKRFPLDAIKLDRSFVKDILVDEFDRALAESIVSPCHKVGLRIVAEGAETRGQLELLRSFGYDEVQGYCFSAPVEPASFAELLRCWRRSECATPARAPKAEPAHQIASRS